jgi:glyoxylase-like metal-dependent hydrolase (beta-lactamase superfamily II)
MTMRLTLHGGFAEKGRTSIGVDVDGYRLLLDTGVKTSARGRDDYYPAISPDVLRATDAIVVTHAHEDHVAALGWCIAGGFRGRIFITPESTREVLGCVAAYGEAAHVDLLRNYALEPLPLAADALRLGPLRIATGRSGHIVGGVWCRLDDARTSFLYCGDIVPASPIFAMDAAPASDVIAIDASYGDDAVRASERAVEVARWISEHPQGCVLATPLYGRSAELLAIVPGPVALAPGMREALRMQIGDAGWLAPGAAEILEARLAAAADWRDGAALPRAALLCHDGMGMAGPARDILAAADAQRHPTLFTGHLPTDSPGDRMVAAGRAGWIRLPTHPTLDENIALAAASGAPVVLGHSCEQAVLDRLHVRMPALRADLATGDIVEW